MGRRIPTVLTVHNARYGGSHDWASLEGLVPVDLARGDADHAGRFNVLKAGLLAADRVTTVSPTFARELQESPAASHGLDYAFRMLGPRLSGILNGIDTDGWDPATDPMLEHRFHARDLAGKAAGKAALCREMGLRPDGPLLAFVGRLVPEKGVDALLEGLLALAAKEPSAQAVVLGSGEARYEDALRGADARLAGIRAAIRLDETLAHRLYAAADVQLVPSWYEPCGLTQMYAMRYGTVPVVNPVGGLRDSVVPWETGGAATGTGAWMDTPDAPGLVGAVVRALGWWRDGATWRRLQANGMGRDLSWGPPAARYADLYRQVLTEAS